MDRGTFPATSMLAKEGPLECSCFSPFRPVISIVENIHEIHMKLIICLSSIEVLLFSVNAEGSLQISDLMLP